MKKYFCLLFIIFYLFELLFANESVDSFWDKVFPKNSGITVEKVKFKNRFGIEIVGDLYYPRNFDKNKKYAGLAICGPYGAVKEQVSGLYAQEFASRGFVSLAFDPSFTGESGGEPRDISSPDINAEDFSSAIDYLLTYKKNIDPNKIGIIGIGGFGGYAIYANISDTRIKVTIASTMYDMPRFLANGYDDIMNEESKYKMKKELNEQRTKDFLEDDIERTPMLPGYLIGNEPEFIKDYYKYYKSKRGYHKRSLNSNNGWAKANSLNIIRTNLFYNAREIDNAVLLVYGELAHNRYFSENVFGKLRGTNKEFFVVKDAKHIDLYDNMKKIPFDNMEKFLRKHLKD